MKMRKTLIRVSFAKGVELNFVSRTEIRFSGFCLTSLIIITMVYWSLRL